MFKLNLIDQFFSKGFDSARLDPDCYQTSRKTIFRISDKAGRGEGKGSSLTETRNALDGVLKIVLRE